MSDNGDSGYIEYLENEIAYWKDLAAFRQTQVDEQSQLLLQFESLVECYNEDCLCHDSGLRCPHCRVAEVLTRRIYGTPVEGDLGLCEMENEHFHCDRTGNLRPAFVATEDGGTALLMICPRCMRLPTVIEAK